jgi:hypothetical protein
MSSVDGCWSRRQLHGVIADRLENFTHASWRRNRPRPALLLPARRGTAWTTPAAAPGIPRTQEASTSEKAAHHHYEAAKHLEQASQHHRQAAEHHERGTHETAAHHAHIAHGHQLHATHHATEAAKHHIEEHGKK